MSETGHEITYHEEHGTHWATCSCARWKTIKFPKQWQAADDALTHIRNVESAKAALNRRVPGLKSQARYYREMSEHDPTVEQRPIWLQLAEELEARLAEKTMTDEDQLPLF